MVLCKSFPSHCAALLLVDHTVKEGEEAVKINEREEQNESGKEKRERVEVLLAISYGS